MNVAVTEFSYFTKLIFYLGALAYSDIKNHLEK